MHYMFVDIENKESDLFLKEHLIDDMVVAEYLYYDMGIEARFVNAILMHLRRFAENYCKMRMDHHQIDRKNPPGSACPEKTLDQMIRILSDHNHLSNDQADKLHNLRKLGNKATHEFVHVDTQDDKKDSFNVKRNIILSHFEFCYDLYRDHSTPKELNGARYQYNKAKIEETYPFSQRILDKHKKIWKNELEANTKENTDKIKQDFEAERVALEETYNEELQKYKYQLVAVEDEMRRLKKEKQAAIENLAQQHEQNLRILEEKLKNEKFKLFAEKLKAEQAYRSEKKKIEDKYNQKLNTKQVHIEELQKNITNLFAALGITAVAAIGLAIGLISSVVQRNQNKN